MVSDFIGSGWAYPLGTSANGSVAVANGPAKLEQAMRLVLSTYPGERPFRPKFGCRLRDYVFCGATVDVLAEIAAEVRRSLRQWEPRADVTDVVVEPSPDDDTLLVIDITYAVKGENDPRNLVFPFYSIPD